VKTCKLKAPPQNIDFSTKRVIVISSVCFKDQDWMIVRSIQKRAINILQIECGPLHVRSSQEKGLIYSLQCVLIGKEVDGLEIKTVPLKLTSIDKFDSQLSEIKKRFIKCEDREIEVGRETAEKVGWNYYDLSQKLHCTDLETIKAEFGKVKFYKLKDLIDARKQRIATRAQYDERLAQISDTLRGPNLI
jgi:hypothetical protein